ncbi:hypothetical protein [Acinetobacter sp. ANC 4558]|uniref:hypothetical protein n=1 Tax=Acinetobacter sp. ANC 4558 TaxID=1977876 RepID=UPI000A34EB20|nr:hypothetical protein [Acinetobacter sp. ANC 4558]
MTEIQQIEMHEIRKLLNAVEILAVRPAQCSENTIGEAVAYFKKLLIDRTNGLFSIELVVNGVVVADQEPVNECNH